MGLLGQRIEIDSIPVEVRRSRRRKTRIGLAFDPAGLVILEAPMDVTDEELYSVVAEHGRWLKHKLARVLEEATCVSTPTYAEGELLQYLGDAYELEVVTGRPFVARREKDAQMRLFSDVRGIVGAIIVSARDPHPLSVKKALSAWYTKEARLLVEERLKRLKDLPWLSGWTPDWNVRFMRSQWGSCSVSGRIAINTHLVKVPVRLLDYVLVHELCHLEHHNHSRRFYGLMSAHMPDWEDRRDELNAYLPLLLH